MENYRLRKNQLTRQKTRDSRKKIAIFKWIAFAIVVTTISTLGIKWLYNSSNASADSAKLLNTNVSDEDTQGYSKIALGYKNVEEQTTVFSGVSENPKELLQLQKGEFVEYLGSSEGWTKVRHKNVTGFVKSSSLKDTQENELVVVDGVLVVTKDYSVPKSFESRFDVETESSMMVMFEAMKREGLEISVSRRQISEDEIVNLHQSNYAFPDYEHHALRTGRSVELTIPNTATVVDFSDTAQGKWLKSNAHKYGFVLAYPEGKEEVTGYAANDRIYTFVGTQNAINMHGRNLTIQEYFVKN